MSFPYLNPTNSSRLSAPWSVGRSTVEGTNFSVLGIGGWMEVANLSDLSLTFIGTGSQTYSGNSIPININIGKGTSFSPNALQLHNDNISSGRRRIGMVVYVNETGLSYQYEIDNYETLWSAATASEGTVLINTYNTSVYSNSIAGQNFINAWTGSTIEGVSGTTRNNARWRIFHGTDTFVTGGTYFSATSTIELYRNDGETIPISGITVTGGTSSNGFTGGTVSGATNFTNGLTANTISATTYQNLPATPFLPLSGGTVSGATNFTEGLTANTISATTYQNLPSFTGDYLPLSGGTVSGRTTTTDLTITGVNSTSGLTRYLVVDISGNTYHQSAGDMTLGSTQTNSGVKTFLDTTLLLRNAANTFNGSFTNTNTADRIYTLPDTAGTIALTSNLSSYVPYTGATANVSLGANSLFTTTLGVGISSSLSSTAHIRGTSPTTGSAFLVQNSTPANVFNVLNSGFVGVGTNTPISLLHIGTSSGTSLGDFTTPALTFNTLNQGIYLDSNRLFFKVAGAFNFGIDSTGVLGNGYRINGAASNNVTTPIFVPSRVSLGLNSGLGGNNAGDISLITSGSTRLRINYNGDLGFFGVTPVARQTLGAATAGATYTATEQGMLQRVYDALRNYGLGT